MKTITNKDIVVTKFIQDLITFIFGKGELHHLDWEEKGIAPNGWNGKGHCTAEALVSFSLTHAIKIKVEDFYLSDGQDYGIKGWTWHMGAGQFVKVTHLETGVNTLLNHWGKDGFASDQEKMEKFRQQLGLS